MSPAMNALLSPQSYSFGQWPASPLSSPAPAITHICSSKIRRASASLAPALAQARVVLSMPIPSQESMPRPMPRPMPMLRPRSSHPCPPADPEELSAMHADADGSTPDITSITRVHHHRLNFMPPPRKSLFSALTEKSVTAPSHKPYRPTSLAKKQGSFRRLFTLSSLGAVIVQS
jgi:hypothetical protein